MYAMPHARAAHDRFWAAIRTALGAGPDLLDQTDDMWGHWLSPDLLLSQTCGLPFRARLHDKVQLVGTPDYGLPGCPPGFYNSVLLVNGQNPANTLRDLDRQTLAYNEPLSQSGWAAPYAHFRDHGIRFVAGPHTGAHAASARAVADGDADIAALDAMTWAMLQCDDPALTAQLKEVGRTTPTPGLPYITARTRNPALHHRAHPQSCPHRQGGGNSHCATGRHRSRRAAPQGAGTHSCGCLCGAARRRQKIKK